MNAEFVTIVSGLPRSGTSMMMQALSEGGMAIMTDHERQPDEDNPKGYYELEAVKKTKEDASWLQSAPGKAVKMIYRLLYDLPDNYAYRVIFMHRDMEEVLASQKKMLQRNKRQGAGLSDEQMGQLFRDQLAEFDSWVSKQPNITLLPVNYSDMIEKPTTICSQVNTFLDNKLNVEAMTSVVDKSLYRNRSNS